MRNENEIFADLMKLCASPGYVHAIANICFRDNMVFYAGELSPPDMKSLFSRERLIRTETSTLIGLLAKGEVDYTIPKIDVLQHYVEQTYALMEEIHGAMGAEMFSAFNPSQISENKLSLFERGSVLREPIFYSGESAYSFQYRDLSVLKYAADDEWLISFKGFSIRTAREVVHGVQKLLNAQLPEVIGEMSNRPREEWTVLPGFTFSTQQISAQTGIDEASVEKVLLAFSLPEEDHNESFQALQDFNALNATPLLRKSDGQFILFEQYSLVQALYETPFYWMISDKSYANTAMRNRGQFTESFSRDRLKLIFGPDRVYTNVEIYESKAKRVGEIDVLVLFGDRAIILQAKSKKLTLEARRGNDNQIQEDFTKSVQDAYNQGFECAKLIGQPAPKFFDGSEEISIPKNLKEIYIFCVISEHYPALNFQVDQFLKYQAEGPIQAPFIMDVFTLDTMTEMLESPIRLLSYVNRRTSYSEKLMASHELIILAFHLKRNLWLDGEYDRVMLDDDISVDLDVAMTVRRENIPGERTPDGVLTHFIKTTVGKIFSEIESNPDPGIIDFGFMLLTLSGRTVTNLSNQIDQMVAKTRRDRSHHDLTLPMGAASEGLVVHCNGDLVPGAAERLRRHCELRKYKHKGRRWFGLSISPSDASLRFGLSLDYEWEFNAEMDARARSQLSNTGFIDMNDPVGKRRKIGRNDSCPCGSGVKFKKCCSDR